MTTAGTPAESAELTDRRAVLSASSTVTGMTLFVASEAVFFAAFFGVYASSYTASSNWPPARVAAPSLLVPTIAVAVLLASAVCMAVGLRTLHRPGYPRTLGPWLAATGAGAAVFTALTAIGLVQLNMSIGAGIYETLFYTLLGLELAHAVGGMALLGLVGVRAWTGELALRRDPVQAAAIYWYFVVGLGAVMYAVLYLGALR
ncbi:MAG TPA: cytochrome c oxidase subunit 3 [Nocardioidaceae bacterium]|jgi:heme/copper-type cytochrome/quinol oxidase subunit 3|nr:cytochrome c oxidase subunit 3 [Nocardioidaceae bacterium]